MKIVINTDVFSKALSEVSLIVSAKPVIAILKYAKFMVSDGHLRIETSNTQANIVKSIDVIANDSDGAFLAPCSELLSLTSKIKDETITLVIDGDTLNIQFALGEAKFKSPRPDDFPIPEIATEEITEIRVPTKFLTETIKNSKNFVGGNDEMRESLKAIYAFVEDAKFGYCATNTQLLITDTFADDQMGKQNINWYIEPIVFAPIVKACATSNIATIRISPKQVSYQIGDTYILSMQTLGKYPNFKRILPTTHKIECKIDKAKMKDMLCCASLILDETNCVRVHIDSINITISVDNTYMGKQILVTTPHSGCNGDMTLGMNLNNMLACLDVCNTNCVSLYINDFCQPIIFHDENAPTKKILLMPMILTNNSK